MNIKLSFKIKYETKTKLHSKGHAIFLFENKKYVNSYSSVFYLNFSKTNKQKKITDFENNQKRFYEGKPFNGVFPRLYFEKLNLLDTDITKENYPKEIDYINSIDLKNSSVNGIKKITDMHSPGGDIYDKNRNLTILEDSIFKNCVFRYLFDKYLGEDPKKNIDDSNFKVIGLVDFFNLDKGLIDKYFFKFFFLLNWETIQKNLKSKNPSKEELELIDSFKKMISIEKIEEFKNLEMELKFEKIKSFLKDEKEKEIISESFKEIPESEKKYIEEEIIPKLGFSNFDSFEKEASDKNKKEAMILIWRDKFSKNVDEFLKNKNIKKDYLKKIFSVNKGIVEKSHIYGIKEIHEALRDEKINIKQAEEYATDPNNCLMLEVNVHRSWDKKRIELKEDGTFKNIDLLEEEWENLFIENKTIFQISELNRKEIKKYLDLREKSTVKKPAG